MFGTPSCYLEHKVKAFNSLGDLCSCSSYSIFGMQTWKVVTQDHYFHPFLEGYSPKVVEHTIYRAIFF
jgi:hypothetical protein